MKIGISPWVWAEWVGNNDSAILERASALGFEAIEIPVLNHDGFDTAAMAALLKLKGLTPIVSTALPEGRDLIHPNPEFRQAGLDFLRYCVDVAVQIGADRVIGPICSAPGRLWLADDAQKGRDFELAAQNLNAVARYASDNGIRLALEVLNRYESSFVNTAAEGLRLADAVDNPAFGLLLDTFHMTIEEKDMRDAILRVGSRLHHVHVIENDRGTPGSGQVDWAGVTDALRKVSYDGWVVIEGFSPRADWLARAICMWRPLADDMEQLAVDGLNFLRAMAASRAA
jgi:D-psicose/D-tagatose/L-ribulose 3-epimerase